MEQNYDVVKSALRRVEAGPFLVVRNVEWRQLTLPEPEQPRPVQLLLMEVPCGAASRWS